MGSADVGLLVRLALSFVRWRRRVLYVGANRTGQNQGVAELVKAGCEVTILEIWPANVEYCRSRLRVAHVVEGDVRELDRVELPNDRYEVAVWRHGPEHVARGEVAPTLAKLEGVGDAVVVSCPWGVRAQAAANGNPHEEHLTSLYPVEFEGLGYEVVMVGTAGEKESHIVAWKGGGMPQGQGEQN